MINAHVFSSPAEAAMMERTWVSHVRNGDEHAMSLLINRHRTRLVRTAANLLRDRHEAEDVSQEAFLKAFREIGKLRDDRAFPGFIYRICVRLCMDRLRLKRAEIAELDPSQEHQGPQVDTRLVVEKLLAKLPYDLKTTLVLREIEQLSYEEVAEAMNVPIGTVRSRLHTARLRFRAMWIEEVGIQ